MSYIEQATILSKMRPIGIQPVLSRYRESDSFISSPVSSMTKAKLHPAPHYFMFVEGQGIREGVKVSPVKATAIRLAETYFSKNRSHKVVLMVEKFDAKTGARSFEEVWSSKDYRPDWNRMRANAR